MSHKRYLPSSKQDTPERGNRIVVSVLNIDGPKLQFNDCIVEVMQVIDRYTLAVRYNGRLHVAKYVCFSRAYGPHWKLDVMSLPDIEVYYETQLTFVTEGS